jgi:hypothetical protein
MAYTPPRASEPAVSHELSAPPPVWQTSPVTVNLLGGVEGYSGSLATRVMLGGTYGVTVGYEPWSLLGFEMGYSGANINLRDVSINTPGANIYRNGGFVNALPGVTFGLNYAGTVGLKPYLLGGIGFDSFALQTGFPTFLGYTSQWMGSVPFGGGLQLRASNWVANARFNFVYDFGTSFTVYQANPLRYQGQLSIGAAF